MNSFRPVLEDLLHVGDRMAGAIFSQNRSHRYMLWRVFDDPSSSLREAVFIMLNPSTADEKKLDPTVTRCADFAKRWGYGSIKVVNLFGIVSADPKILFTHPNPIGRSNNAAIISAAYMAELVIVAWGAHPKARKRASEVIGDLKFNSVHPKCLGKTKAGFPRHPLYLRSDTQPIEF